MHDPVLLVIIEGIVVKTSITKDHKLCHLNKGHNLKQQRLLRPWDQDNKQCLHPRWQQGVALIRTDSFSFPLRGAAASPVRGKPVPVQPGEANGRRQRRLGQMVNSDPGRRSSRNVDQWSGTQAHAAAGFEDDIPMYGGSGEGPMAVDGEKVGRWTGMSEAVCDWTKMSKEPEKQWSLLSSFSFI